MSSHGWRVGALVLMLSMCALGRLGRAADPAGKPNIILILADDLGYGDLSGYGAVPWQKPEMAFPPKGN